MKKILAVIDAVNFKEEQLDAFQYIAGMLQSTLTIVMLEDVDSMPLMAPDFAEGVPGHNYEIVLRVAEEKGRVIKENTALLQKICAEKEIPYTLHSNKGAAIEEVLLESRFADLLLAGKELSSAFLYDTNPTRFIKNVLAHSQCPVLLIPEDMSTVKGAIFTYNGTFSSVYAIRQFVQLFPELVKKSASVLYVCEKGNDTTPHEKLLKEYLSNYATEVAYKVFSGNADTVLQEYLQEKKGYITTFGAYGRSRLSRFFNSSSADNILRELKGPVFITHP